MGFFASEGCMRLRLHVDAIAVVVFCYRAVAVQAAFIASFMHLNNLKPQDDTSSVSFGQTDIQSEGVGRGTGKVGVSGAGNANYVMCQVTGKFILIAVEMQYCIYAHTHKHGCIERRRLG